MRPRVVVSHPAFEVLGGGEVVAAWTLQALADGHEVVLVCRDPVDFAEIDGRFGTSLQAASPQVRVLTWPAWMRWFHRCWPGGGDRWRHLFQEWRLLRLARAGPVAAWVGTFNESRLPAPGVQYVHFPARRAASGWAERGYAGIVRAFSKGGLAGPETHRTLVNSHFTEAEWTRLNKTAPHVLYPPVLSLGEGLAWEERSVHRMICLGRLLPDKGLERAARIVAGVRAHGVSLTLSVVGGWSCPWRQRRKIERALRGFAWIEWHGVLTRAELETLAGASRYGLHGMKGEPFGIAVAELQSAGCVVFADGEGGPAEILGGPETLYRDEADAVQKILAVTRSPRMQAELHAAAKSRARLFAPDRFMAGIREAVNFARNAG